MGVRQPGQHPRRDPERAADSERAALAQQLTQVLALDELHDDEVVALVGVEVVDLHDPRVLERGRGAGLVGEALQVALDRDQAGVEHLERDLPIEAGVVGAVGRAHAPFADLFEDRAAAELEADQLAAARGGRVFAGLEQRVELHGLARRQRLAVDEQRAQPPRVAPFAQVGQRGVELGSREVAPLDGQLPESDRVVGHVWKIARWRAP